MSDLGDAVLSYILPANREGMDYALKKLDKEHFDNETNSAVHQVLWSILVDYADRYGEVFDSRHLASLLRNTSKVDPARLILYVEHYRRFCETHIPRHAFEYAVDALIKERHKKLFGDAMADAWTIFKDPKGLDVDGTVLRGDDEAREFLAGRLGHLEQAVSNDAPEGDMREDIQHMLSSYTDRKNNPGQAAGTSYGIECLDEYTGGFRPGDLTLIAGFTSHGKSQFCAQLAWHTAVVERKPVFFATSETVRDITMHRILTRHSRLPKFGLPQGLDLNKIVLASLTDQEYQLLIDVGEDFVANSAPLHVCQMPSRPTLGYVERRANAVNRLFPIHLLIMDEFRLLKPDGWSAAGEREHFNEVLRNAKGFATSFGGGRGVAFVSPWQMSRPAFNQAKIDGYYEMGSLSDTSEAEKAPDTIISILRVNTETNEVFLQILKNRNGPLMEPRSIYVDYRTSYLGESRSAAAIDTSQINSNSGLMDLL